MLNPKRLIVSKDNLYNKRVCPQTMFKILRLWRQYCQRRIAGLPKTWGLEKDSEKVKEIRKRELKIKMRGGGGRTRSRHG
jgi:hypothetical protein